MVTVPISTWTLITRSAPLYWCSGANVSCLLIGLLKANSKCDYYGDRLVTYSYTGTILKE